MEVEETKDEEPIQQSGKKKTILRLTGLQDSINTVLALLDSITNDPQNYKLQIPLIRNPKENEQEQIKQYLLSNFGVSTKFFTIDGVSEIQIKGLRVAEAKIWITSKLMAFLQSNFPK